MAIYRKEMIGDLDVISTYKELMEVSLGEDSAYIRAKETVASLVKDTDLTAREKADIVSKTVGSIASNITNQALQAAITIAKENREAPYVLTKLKYDTLAVQTNIDNATKEGKLLDKKLDKDIVDIEATKIQALSAIANTKLETGANISLPTTWGLSYTNDESLKGLSIEAAKAGVYNSWANAYRTNGQVRIDGSYKNPVLTDTKIEYAGMVDMQREVANRNKKAFDDNMRQHAANSSAAMLGTMLSSAAFKEATAYTPYLSVWKSSIDYLTGNNNGVSASAGVLLISNPDDVTKSESVTISGTFDNVVLGTTVTITAKTSTGDVLAGGVVLVNDGDWTITGLDLRSPLEVTVTASGSDSTGQTRVDRVILPKD